MLSEKKTLLTEELKSMGIGFRAAELDSKEKLSPEQRLCARVLVRAVEDYLWNICHKRCDAFTSLRACEAGDWIFHGNRGKFTYYFCCEAVGIHPLELRKKIIACIDKYIDGGQRHYEQKVRTT